MLNIKQHSAASILFIFCYGYALKSWTTDIAELTFLVGKSSEAIVTACSDKATESATPCKITLSSSITACKKLMFNCIQK